jgi:hypothetical protein
VQVILSDPPSPSLALGRGFGDGRDFGIEYASGPANAGGAGGGGGHAATRRGDGRGSFGGGYGLTLGKRNARVLVHPLIDQMETARFIANNR